MRASGPTCTRRAFQVRPHSTAASKQCQMFNEDLSLKLEEKFLV